MSERYDVIVVGAGNGGLTAAATTAKHGLKTLLLERHNLPGGSATSFRRGRFEFEPSLHELADVGTAQNPGSVRKLFDELGAEVDWRIENTAFRLVVPGPDGFDVSLPTGIEAFADGIEQQVPGSRESVLAVFTLAEQAERAITYLGQGAPDMAVLAAEYPDFMRMASHTVEECLNALGMPKRAQQIFCTYWCYLGAPADQLDFLHYVLMLIRYVDKGAAMPYMRSHELSLALENSLRKSGGEIWYNTEVTRILVKDSRAYGVIANGRTLYADQLIVNAFPDTVYATMLEPVEVPARSLKLSNARELGLSFITVYLGMNRTAQELGIRDYSVFVSPTADSRQQYQLCQSLEQVGHVIMNCLNVVIPDSSPPGTSTLFFTAMYFGDVWATVSPQDYKKVKNRIAAAMIEQCEAALHLSIRPYIEEISIAAPPTFARYLNTPRGIPYGYQNTRWDGMMPRILARREEELIKGLRFCGAHAERTDGYSSVYINGRNAALLTIADRKEEV